MARTPNPIRRFERETHRGLALGGAALSTSPVVVAVSGGADSTALLLATFALSQRPGCSRRIVPCYVDHGLRARSEIDAEVAALRELCASRGVEIVCRAADVSGPRRAKRLSWEDAARRARYGALAEVAAEAGAGTVLTGHTRDDQVETVLLRLLRGTGLRGLKAMAARSSPWGDSGPVLCRPLLSLGRADTEAYCRARGVAWLEDSSNDSSQFLRNRVRHELVPMIEALRPGSSVAVYRLAGQARELDDFLTARMKSLLEDVWRPDGDDFLLSRTEQPLDRYLALELIASALAKLYDAPGAPSERHVLAVWGLWTKLGGRGIELPDGWTARPERSGIRFARRQAVAPDWDGRRWQLVEGSQRIPGWTVTVSRARSGSEVHPLAAAVRARDASDMSIRFWQPGTRMRPTGMTGTRKLQDVFVDAKVPRRERRRVPLAYLNEACIWAVGVKRSAAAPPVVANGDDSWLLEFKRDPDEGVDSDSPGR